MEETEWSEVRNLSFEYVKAWRLSDGSFGRSIEGTS